MLNDEDLIRILADQREQLLQDFTVETVQRTEETFVNPDSPQAQVVIGVRRCGKSTICRNVIKSTGKLFAYVNFDDENLAGLGAEDLNRVLECLYRIYGQFEILFMDEIQNVEGWHLFVNRLLRQRIHVLITGSNSKLLSSELATYLTGRSNQVEVFPFSFSEFCQAQNVETDNPSTVKTAMVKNAFDRYLEQGGFPELLFSNLNPIDYVNGLTKNILKIDIISRHRIKYRQSFEKFAENLLNIAPAELNYGRLSAEFGFKSVHTARNYTGFLTEAYLLTEVNKYSGKSRERLTNTKVYNIDCSLMGFRENAFAHSNRGWRLETVVLLELLRRKRESLTDVYYFKDRIECDFVVCRFSQTLQCIQVCWNIDDGKKLRRELNGLEKASQATGCNNLLLLTYGESTTLKTSSGKKVIVRPVYDWLLKGAKTENSLEKVQSSAENSLEKVQSNTENSLEKVQTTL